MRLSREDLLRVVRSAPVAAIDLVVRNEGGEVLLGLRANRPARGTWFVPGGRIRKGERLDDAFARISRDELGVRLDRARSRLLGAYEHHYDENFAGDPGFGTHYVVLAHEIKVGEALAEPADAQHERLRWWKVSDLLASAEVHANTKAYFER